MLSFVRRLNPFRRQSEVTPQNVTRSVQTDINGSFPSGYGCSRTNLQDTNDNNVSRKGINKLLQVFEKENLNVATLMDQEGRIFFTIDLTEVIFKDAELENIVRVVQKTMEESSHHNLSNNSDEISKKLKRHFLFESMKRLSESYHSNAQANNKEIGAHSMEAVRNEMNRGACEYNKSSISAHETELKSLLYEAKSSIIPGDNEDLMEGLKSSLATKIFKKIEQTIDSIKRKHNYNHEIGSNANISIVFSRHCNPGEQKRRNVSYKNPNPEKRPQTRQKVPKELLNIRGERIENKLKHSSLDRSSKQSDSSVEQTSEYIVKRNKCDPKSNRKDAVEKARKLIVLSTERLIISPTRNVSNHKNSKHNFLKTKRKTELLNRNESSSVEKNKKDKKYKLRRPNTKTKEYKKYSPKRRVKISKDRINRESLDNKTRQETKQKPKEKKKGKVEQHWQDREKVKEKPTGRDETKQARPVTHHVRQRKTKDKTTRDEKHSKRKGDNDCQKPEEKVQKAEKNERTEKSERAEKTVEQFMESEHVVVLFNSNKRGDDKSKRRKSQSVKKEVKEVRPIRERCAFTSSDNSQVHRGIMETNSMACIKPRDIPPGSSEKLIAVISFGPPQ